MGLLMCIHYGCAIVKHRAQESDWFLKLTLIFKLICAVLIVRASRNADYEDLLVAVVMFSSFCIALSLYAWAHGSTFIELGSRLRAIKLKNIIQSIKDTI